VARVTILAPKMVGKFSKRCRNFFKTVFCVFCLHFTRYFLGKQNLSLLVVLKFNWIITYKIFESLEKNRKFKNNTNRGVRIYVQCLLLLQA